MVIKRMIMADAQRDRYTMEYELIPGYMYSDKATDFVNTILIKKQYLIMELYQIINADVPGYICPYTAKDFGVDAIVVGNIAGIMRIHMPAPVHAGDMIRVYICHDAELRRARLYTVRVDDDNDTCFMTWVDNEHYINHGKFKLSESDEMKTVMNFYMKYLAEN